MAKVHLENYITVLYAKLNLQILKKEHPDKNQFLESH